MTRSLQRWDRSPTSRSTACSFLLYGLLDVVVDGYFDAVQAFDDYYDEVSERIFAEHPLDPAQQRHWFQMRQALVRFHRLVVPMREAVSASCAGRRAVADELYPYFQDVYDHILRVSESTDALRDLGRHDRRDQPQPARLPPEPDHEEGHELGGDRRRAHADHRLLRDERAVPRVRPGTGACRVVGADDLRLAVGMSQQGRFASAGMSLASAPIPGADWMSPAPDTRAAQTTRTSLPQTASPMPIVALVGGLAFLRHRVLAMAP